MSFHPLEHKLISSLKSMYGLEKKDYVLFCSGGLDSICLFHLLKNVGPVFNYTLKVVHIHHGSSKDFSKQTEYRDKALSFVKLLCMEHEVDFESKESEAFLKSEEECRDFRLTVSKEYLSKGARVFLAHHQDDLFETLLLRLIRGTGPEGFMNPFSMELERPLLKLCTKKDLESYKSDEGFDCVIDPSNEDTEFLRNWLRHSWLKNLDEQAHGAKPFRDSLLRISEVLSQTGSNFTQFIHFEDQNKGFFNVSDYFGLNQVQKKSFITHILHRLKKSGYTSGQVSEVVKHLERQDQAIEFRVSSVKWTKTQAKVCFENA